MRKNRTIIKESQLHNLVKGAVKRILKENENTEVFTISAFDVIDEHEVWDGRFAVDYDSADEAIDAAWEFAQQYSNDENVIIVTVFGGEYRKPNGDVVGDPFDIYTISNKDKETTLKAHSQADEYVDSPSVTESKLRGIIQEAIKSVLNENSNIFDEFDSDMVCVSDLNLIYQGTRIDYVINNDGNIEFWAGNPETDKYAEQLMIPRQTARTYMEMIEDKMF